MNKLENILSKSIEFSFDYVTLLNGDVKKVLRIREYYGNQEIMLDLMSLDSMSLESRIDYTRCDVRYRKRKYDISN